MRLKDYGTFAKSVARNVFIAGGVFGAAWAADALITRVFREEDEYDDRYLVSTNDDHQIALYRYEPDTEPTGSPVLLVHGLSSNHRNLAMNDRDGLAQYLAAEGYDCWAVELRGRIDEGSSDQPWGFDEYVQQDLPAAVNFITGETTSDAVHWIGHSMGGMAYLAYAGALGNSDRIRSGVTIGSPVILDEPAWIRVLGSSYRELPDELRTWLDIPARKAFRVVFSSIPTRILFLLIVEEKITLNGLKILANAIEDGLDPRITLQFMEWISGDDWSDRSGNIDYRAGLEDVTAPTMTVVGEKDHLCPDCETAGCDLIGAEEKRCLIGSEVNGSTERSYDHISLVFGKRAKREIFPEIKGWLDEHDG